MRLHDSKICDLGRVYDPLHATCRSCPVGCALKAAKKEIKKVSVVQEPVQKRQKYGNKKVEVDGIIFDSSKEARRYQDLKLLESGGKISDLTLQKTFELAPAVYLHGRKKPALRYVADFVYCKKDNPYPGEVIIEDVKSKATRKNRAYRIKIHFMKSVLGLDVEEI
ncbi:MAG: DUF1064 domain-containing protein [Dehalococcoidia bacterium]|jgi:hypothetical protein